MWIIREYGRMHQRVAYVFVWGMSRELGGEGD